MICPSQDTLWGEMVAVMEGNTNPIFLPPISSHCMDLRICINCAVGFVIISNERVCLLKVTRHQPKIPQAHILFHRV